MNSDNPTTDEYKVIGCNDPADKHLVGKTLHSNNPEWTHSWLGQPVDPSPLTEAIAHHHNAALAAEREKLAEANDMWDRASRQADTLSEYLVDAKADLSAAQQQLSAERKNNDAQSDAYVRRINELNQQLAAEREERDIVARSRNVWQLQVAEHSKTIQQLREQLAAAVEALQMLRDFQNGCPLPSYEKGWNEAMAMADKVLRSRLAQVKEGK